MDKYIKESDLFKRLLNVDFKHDYDGCIKFCQSIPAADVVEVRYGRWIIYNVSPWDGEDVKCSVCGEKGCAPYWDYCPHCGAKMDEVSE